MSGVKARRTKKSPQTLPSTSKREIPPCLCVRLSVQGRENHPSAGYLRALPPLFSPVREGSGMVFRLNKFNECNVSSQATAWVKE